MKKIFFGFIFNLLLLGISGCSKNSVNIDTYLVKMDSSHPFYSLKDEELTINIYEGIKDNY